MKANLKMVLFNFEKSVFILTKEIWFFVVRIQGLANLSIVLMYTFDNICNIF